MVSAADGTAAVEDTAVMDIAEEEDIAAIGAAVVAMGSNGNGGSAGDMRIAPVAAAAPAWSLLPPVCW